jgi:hypothetical protein
MDAAIFVSKRLQRIAFAFLCLLAGHLAVALASPEPGVLTAPARAEAQRGNAPDRS